jgi:hypothetical protein
MGRQQGVLAHQAQHAGTGDADVVQDAQPRPYLAVTLAGEGRGVQIGADGARRSVSAIFGFRATPRRVQGDHRGRFPGLLGIDRRTGKFEHPAHPFQTVGLASAFGGLAAHRDDLRPTKGRFARLSFCRISTSMTSSPIRRLASSSWRASGSFSRSLRPASIPVSARSRHCSSL